MAFSSKEYWNGLPCVSAGDGPDPWIEPRYPALQADSLLAEPLENPGIQDIGEQTDLIDLSTLHPWRREKKIIRKKV